MTAAISPPYQITLVLDAFAGAALPSLVEDGATWVVHSASNRAAVEQLWQAYRKAGTSLDLTIFTSPQRVESREEWDSILDSLETHHGEGAHEPPMNAIRVVGVPFSPAARDAFEALGFHPPVETQSGFLVLRARCLDR